MGSVGIEHFVLIRIT